MQLYYKIGMIKLQIDGKYNNKIILIDKIYLNRFLNMTILFKKLVH